MSPTSRFVVVLLIGWLCSAAPARAEKLVLVAGGGSGGDGGPAREAKLITPFGVDFDRNGDLFFVEFTGYRVRKIDRRGVLTTIAGTGEKGYAGDGGPASKAQFDGLHNLAIGPDGAIYLADTWNNRVRKIDARTGEVRTIAGGSEKGFGGDGGPATAARVNAVHCVALDPKGERLYLADLGNRRIRVIELRSGIIRTVAGNGERGVPEDGAEATKAPLMDPRAVAAGSKGEVYVLERAGNALRVVDSSGKIRTVAGTGRKGSRGDGGEALKADLNGPKHLCVDRAGDVLIADTENHVIRKYLPREGKIIRVAGSGRKGTAGLDGPPRDAELSQPHGVLARPDGTVYIADSSNGRILKIQP